MNQFEFVENVIKPKVRDSALRLAINYLQNTPIEDLPESIKSTAVWCRSSSREIDDYVTKAIMVAVDKAIFRFLVVLDGTTSIADGDGSCCLHYKQNNNNGLVPLAGVEGLSDDLADIFRSDYPEGFSQMSEVVQREKALQEPHS